MTRALVGTPSLVRLALRRDRIRLSVWILAILGIVYFSTTAVPEVYGTPEAIRGYQQTVGTSPAAIAMSGPPVALDTLGGILVYETSVTALIAVSLMAIFLVVRHTRGDEEDGRTEVLRSTVVGRHAQTAAALLVVGAASLLVGLGVTASVRSTGVPLAGSLVYGAAVAALGIVFACIAAAVAQLMTTARGAIGLSVTIFGAVYLVRAFGDVRENWVVWLSPMGWSQQVRAFDDNRWWPLALSMLCAVVATGTAVVLANSRDLGAGIVPARPGPPEAAPALSSPVGLARRLQRGSIIGWMAGMFVGGAATGLFTEDIEEMVEGNETLAEVMEAAGQGSLVEMYLSTMLLILGLLAAGYAVSSALRLRSEEVAGRLEPVLATAVSRNRWLLGTLSVTLIGTLLVAGAGGLGLGLTHGLVSGDIAAAWSVLGDSLVYLPAVLVLAALAVLLFGWLPRLALLTWAALALCFLIGYLGLLLRFPDWVENLSPFTHTPAVPVDPVTPGPLVVLSLLAVLLVAAGLAGFRRRDIG
jgi:ABC-2 type transport system permease protein